MKIVSLNIQNFRGLRYVTMPKTKKVNVIVGPNAIGKSTLLEAIRMVKVLLSPRLNGEGGNALQQIGALSPHNQQLGSPGIDFASLAYEPANIIRLRLDIQLDEQEIAMFTAIIGDLSLLLLKSESVQDAPDSPLAFTQFLSTQEGKDRLAEKIREVELRVRGITTDKILSLELTMDPTAKTLLGNDIFSQSIIAMFDRRLPNHKTYFSLFPADRSFPQGEQAIQVGAADAAQQIQSHMSQPSLKYARLKHTIIQHIMLHESGRETITKEFNLIFDNLLPGKQLDGININELGLVKILVKDKESGKKFDIDQMSSGEKGLVLTFLFLRLSMTRGGVVLLDEPELHLNAAVQSRIMPFIKEHCVDDLGVQVFICTHSPEIVKDAYDDENCFLYHLRASDDLTPVLKQDQEELFEVFERLGNSTADVLFTKGSIYVEGEHDTQIILAGYSSLVSGYKLTALGGRGDVEREFPILLKEEQAGRLKKPALFIIDGDRKKTKLRSGRVARIHQHSRYCLENFLLDSDIIFDLLTSHAKKQIESRGVFPNIIEEMALDQTREIAIADVYTRMSPESPGMRTDDYRGRTIEEAAIKLSERLTGLYDHISDFDKEKWTQEFTEKTKEFEQNLRNEWKQKWKELASGKTIIDSLYEKYEISMKKVEFKKEIIKLMALRTTEDWRIIRDVLVSELQKA